MPGAPAPIFGLLRIFSELRFASRARGARAPLARPPGGPCQIGGGGAARGAKSEGRKGRNRDFRSPGRIRHKGKGNEYNVLGPAFPIIRIMRSSVSARRRPAPGPDFRRARRVSSPEFEPLPLARALARIAREGRDRARAGRCSCSPWRAKIANRQHAMIGRHHGGRCALALSIGNVWIRTQTAAALSIPAAEALPSAKRSAPGFAPASPAKARAASG